MLWMMHDPPEDSVLDMCYGGHVGSLSIRRAIEVADDGLLATFHGHIHETVDGSVVRTLH